MTTKIDILTRDDFFLYAICITDIHYQSDNYQLHVGQQAEWRKTAAIVDVNFDLWASYHSFCDNSTDNEIVWLIFKITTRKLSN